jgi:signal transduction histidine kinase/DNA-binding response OmpR family regulator/ABC-type amino acid transport substrate-binding protein
MPYGWENPPFECFTEIPGVTAEEVEAIKALRARFRDSVFVYGMSYSKEAFGGPDGQVRGYAALVSEHIGTLFGLTITPVLYEWGDLLAGLASGEVSFTNELTPNEERRQTFYMTDAIGARSVKYFRLEGSETFETIRERRRLRFAFFNNTTTIDLVLASIDEEVDTLLTDTYGAVYELLRSGEADAFFADDVSIPALEKYGRMVEYMHLPPIYESISIATQRPELEPVISVLNKMLQNGGMGYFNHLYSLGIRKYMVHKLASKLTQEELDFVNSAPVVRLAAEYDNYPFSFYNTNEGQWQGMTLDVLREIEAVTGITFEIINDTRTEFPDLKRMVEAGEASIITELIRTKNREGRFLWPSTPIQTGKYALISTINHRQVRINEIMHLRVGVQANTAYAELLERWFPDHQRTVVYSNVNALFDALERNEVDVVMSSQTQIVAVTNYMERPGYKINVLFNYGLESSLALNINERLLCSVIDKALKQIDLYTISELWMHKTFDYRIRLAQSRYPLLISISIMLLFIIAFILILYKKSHDMKRRMHSLVEERTSELNGQNDLMEAVTKGYKGIMWSLDKNGVITTFDGRYLQVLDIEPSSMVGKTLEQARQDSHYIDIITDFETILKGGPQEWTSDIEGSTFLSSAMPIYDINENITGVAGSTDDITEVVRLSQYLEEALESANSANNAKSAFLANMSHEIRTPMNSVIGFSELALDYNMPEKPREYLGKILENSKWLLQIINDILDLSKIEAGKMTLEKIPFDLNEMFMLCKTATIPKALEKGLVLHFYAEPFVGRKLLGDPTRLRQIFINLISNAVKFTNSGTVKVSAVLTENEDDGDAVSILFEVRDSGIGMTPQQMKRVLEPFSQADDSTTRKYGGTGLGLSIIKSLIELMGGKLTIESTPGVGSKFSFNLTFETVDVPVDDTGANVNIYTEEIKRPLFDAEVLVCEDNHMNQEVIRRHLERIGLRMVIAGNGAVGVDHVKGRMEKGDKQFDLILMDIQMPVMDGFEASAKIMEFGLDLPIIAMTANVMSSDRERYSECGMHDCVGKPFTSQELWHCLLRHLKPVEVNNMSDSQIYDDDLQVELQTIFVNDNQQKFAEFKGAVESGDLKMAHRIAHTLKSNAGTIGKTALQKIAAETEKRLHDGQNTLTDDVVDTLEKELNAVLQELAPFLKKQRPTTESADASSAEPLNDALLDELEELLRKGSPDSLKFADNLRAMPGGVNVVEQMENFDFDEAAEALAELRKKGL